ncbi:ABC transporter permease [Clostridium akagii]|uniref:ABC transporter permease n=1 Tax=Clostridium akagii TaxID=91623 RepID=UPI00047AA959|nr:ABC transporter permease [Clostridium akagii]
MKYVVRKIITLIITLVFVSGFTFFAFNVVPGDPALVMLGTNASPQKLENLREELGLNQSLVKRYISWSGNFVKGDMGKSIRFSQPVKNLIVSRIPVTFSLALMSLLLIVAISIPLGVYSAKKEGTFIDVIISTTSQISRSIPSFFMGIILILVFGIILQLFSPGKYVDYNQDIVGFFLYLICPSLAIAIPNIATLVKFLRAGVLNEMSKDYVRTAYSKGNKENSVLYNHILKNAIITVITLMGMIISEILAGSLIIEQLFGLPGIGSLLIMSVSTRDFPLIQALVLYIAFIVIFINFLVDILYQIIDPRIRVR